MTILCSNADDESSIDAKTAQDKLKKAKIKLPTELRKVKSRIQAL